MILALRDLELHVVRETVFAEAAVRTGALERLIVFETNQTLRHEKDYKIYYKCPVIAPNKSRIMVQRKACLIGVVVITSLS